LKDDSLNGQKPIVLTLPSGTTTQGGHAVVLTDDNAGSVCGATPYPGQQYLQYTAPDHYIGADTFNYVIAGPGNQTDHNVINVTVSGTIEFKNSIFPQMNAAAAANGCSSCHGPSGTYGAGGASFMPNRDAGSPLAATTINAFYRAICNSSGGNGPCVSNDAKQVTGGPAPGALVVLGDSTAMNPDATMKTSQLYSEPNSPHTVAMPTFTSFAADVLQWVREGAYCTTTGGACPAQ
jgi:hypothetical protein